MRREVCCSSFGNFCVKGERKNLIKIIDYNMVRIFKRFVHSVPNFRRESTV